MAVEADVLEQLVRRAQSPDVKIRSAALQQIDALPDEDLLQLLANHTWPVSPNPLLLGRRMLPPVLYTAFTIGVVGALTREPWICCFLFLSAWILTMALISLRSRLLERRRHRGLERVPTRLFGSIASFLIGRTNPCFLPYLLSGVSEDAGMFERAREGTEAIPSHFMFLHVGRGPSSTTATFPRDIIQQRRRYRRLLKAMLSQIGSEEEIELSPEQRHAFLILLKIPEEDVELTLSILTRLERWGDTQTVSALKRLIREKQCYVGSDQVEAAACHCLERVEARLQQQKQSNILLRPTLKTEAVPPRSLLRPAADPPENAPEQLLRPESALPPEKLR
ncbi:MAG: hypothetical protein JWL77_1967 [Chthonomonadaceae bacterium]|nr:hypothetical protein [Chthonomonadaceae bacterium]